MFTLIDLMTMAGLVGFAKDYGTTRSFKDTGTDELFFILQSSALPFSQHEHCCRGDMLHVTGSMVLVCHKTMCPATPEHPLWAILYKFREDDVQS